MNICMFAKGLPVHVQGGMEMHVEDLINGLVKRGHRVTVITTKHPRGIKREEDKNLKIYYVGDKPLKYTKTFFKESAELFEAISKQEGFDIVHSQSIAGAGVVRFTRTKLPIVVTLHGTILNEIKSALNNRSLKGYVRASYLLLKMLMDKTDRLLLKRANKIIAVSHQLCDDIRQQYRIPEEKLVTIPNGVNIDRFKPLDVSDLKERLNLLSGEKILLSVGKIEKQKGHHLLLKILPDISKVHAVKTIIVGGGSYLTTLKKMTVKFGITDKVIFTGEIYHKDLPRYYNLADIFVFPTLMKESFGLVIAEAMACGKPVIASRIGGVPTVIEDGKDGFLIKPNNLRDLKEKILVLLGDEKLAKKIGKTAREKVVRRFSVDRMVNDTIKTYEKFF